MNTGLSYHEEQDLKHMAEEVGVVKGEVCNRNGCGGIIDEHEKEGSCSCHINPPCGYCTTDSAYCPVCDWEAGDEPIKKIDPEIEKRNMEYYRQQREDWDAKRKLFYARYNGKEPINELQFWSEGHTHFTMIKRGVFPKGTETRATIEPKVKGTFGGRFNSFGEYSFEYIAYTD
jgi:hypothetical protein